MSVIDLPPIDVVRLPRQKPNSQQSCSMSEPLIEIVTTGVAAAGLSTVRKSANELATRQAWQRIIDDKLSVWLKDPIQLEDEGVEAPSNRVLRESDRAGSHAPRLRLFSACRSSSPRR